MRVPTNMRFVASVLLVSGCVAYSTRTIDNPSAMHGAFDDDQSEVQLISPSGATTSWIAAWRLSIVGDMICLRMGQSPWTQVSKVRVSQLTDATVALILGQVPYGVDVRHLLGGAVELDTEGHDLTRWVTSRAHDPEAEAIARYEVEVLGRWHGPLTWPELARLGTWMAGWPVHGTSAQVRRVSVASSVALTVLAAPVVLVAAGIAVVGRASFPMPRDDRSPRESRAPGELAARDVPLALVAASTDTQTFELAGNWPTRPCYEQSAD